jgi:UDP-GlcNAc3NAcA epimerase
MKILTIVGARPQFIKAGSVSREVLRLSEEGENIKEVLVHTGQHYDTNMSDIFFEQMHIPKPAYFLGVGGKSQGAMTGQMIEKIEEILFVEKPDWVVVYGDTNSTLAGALAASKLHIKVAHIESGLRSFNMRMPEEVNRVLTDRVSSLLFCPTDTSVINLKNEGFPFSIHSGTKQTLSKVGDVMQDGAIFYKNLSAKPKLLMDEKLKIDCYILCTIHRAENTDDKWRLRSILEALNEIAKEKNVILPIHPRTKKLIELYSIKADNIIFIDPVGYLEMVWLIDNCHFVMTDSGGLQKEAYFFEKPCITLRDETEWVELLAIGVNILVGADKEKIFQAYKSIKKFNNKNSSLDLYGGGKASERIVKQLLDF